MQSHRVTAGPVCQEEALIHNTWLGEPETSDSSEMDTENHVAPSGDPKPPWKSPQGVRVKLDPTPLLRSFPCARHIREDMCRAQLADVYVVLILKLKDKCKNSFNQMSCKSQIVTLKCPASLDPFVESRLSLGDWVGCPQSHTFLPAGEPGPLSRKCSA